MRKNTRYKAAIAVGVVILIYYKFFSVTEPDWNFSNINEAENLGREINFDQRYDRWIIITTIQYPTDALKTLSRLAAWRVIVVGDRKTPKDWKLSNVVYLDPSAQKSLKYRVHEYLPYDSYTRKIIGYLYAIEHGAQFIYETDDDNLIANMDGFHTIKAYKGLVLNTFDLTYNPYPHFGQSSVWPRGYPLEYIGQTQPRDYHLCSIPTPAIQQGLVNGEPDLDAIFRMTRRHIKVESGDIKFDSSAPVVIVPQGTFAPTNAQNTLYLHKAFWSLILPTMCTDRATDIYRSYWAQKLLWLVGGNVAFYPPVAYQKRNSWHKHIKDAKEEQEIYMNMGRYINFLNKWKCNKLFLFDCMTQLTEDLVIMGFWSKRDLEVVNAWVTDLSTIRYAPPALKQTSSSFTCELSDDVEIIHYPWEQNISMQYINEMTFLPQSNNLKIMQSHVSDICGLSHHIYLENAIEKSSKFHDVLLVVTIYGSIDVIPTLDVIYRIHFPHILYCGYEKVDKEKLHSWRVSYIGLPVFNPVICVSEASKMNYKVSGYLHVTQNIFLQFEKLHVSNRNKNQMWVTGLDLYIFKESIKQLCNQKTIDCVKTNKETYFILAEKLKYITADNQKTKEYIKCIKKVGSDPTLKTTKITTSKELSFYIPDRLSSTLHELLEVYLKDSSFQGLEFIAVLIMECAELTTEYLHSTDLQDMDSTDHYDYIFPFLFKNITVREGSLFKTKYCEYIKSH